MRDEPASGSSRRRTHRHFLGQIGNRGVLRLRIPIAPEPRDIELLIHAFGFHGAMSGKAAKKVQEIANEQGIGKLCRFFTISRRLAASAHERLNWAHFNSSVATIDSWSIGEFGNGKSQKQLGNGGGEAPVLQYGQPETFPVDVEATRRDSRSRAAEGSAQ
jgi:hypothetical protein